MSRTSLVMLLAPAVLLIVAPEALAQAGGGSSGFGGGGGGGSGGGGGGFGGGSSEDGDDEWGTFDVLIVFFLVLMVFGVPSYVRRRVRSAAAKRRRDERDEHVTTASAEAAEEDPVFAADAVKPAASALYAEVQDAWTRRDDDALQRLLGDDLLAERRLRLDDFRRKGWVNEVSIRRGPEVDYVGLVNRQDVAEDRVTVAIAARLHSVVRTSAGQVITRDADADGDGEIDVCEYWTLARAGDGWRLVSIEQEHEGEHHLQAAVVPAPWSDTRLGDESLVELASADAPRADIALSDLVSVEFDGTARAKALDLSLADPRCSPDVLEAVARRTAAAWAEAVDGDDTALLEIAAPDAARALLYPEAAHPRARLVVRGPELRHLAITALDTDSDPARMQVEAHLRGARYVEDRETPRPLREQGASGGLRRALGLRARGTAGRALAARRLRSAHLDVERRRTHRCVRRNLSATPPGARGSR